MSAVSLAAAVMAALESAEAETNQRVVFVVGMLAGPRQVINFLI